MTTSPDTRQQRRLQKRAERKAEHRKPLSEKAKRLSFKAAKQHFAEIKKATEAQFHLGPVAVQMAMMVILSSLGAYRSRGKGRGTAARRYGNNSTDWRHATGEQESLRRRLGGFAQCRRLSAMTKRECIAWAGKHRGNLKRAADLPMEAFA